MHAISDMILLENRLKIVLMNDDSNVGVVDSLATMEENLLAVHLLGTKSHRTNLEIIATHRPIVFVCDMGVLGQRSVECEGQRHLICFVVHFCRFYPVKNEVFVLDTQLEYFMPLYAHNDQPDWQGIIGDW